jgi:hypothetical protein
VVATNIRGCRESVIEGVTGKIVPPRDAVALGAAVTALLRDPDGRREMGKNARRIACEKYDYREVAKRFVDFIQYSINFRSLSHDNPAPAVLDPGRRGVILVSALAVVTCVTGLYAVPALMELRWFGDAGAIWPIVVAGDAPGSLILGLLSGWRWGLATYVCLSILEWLLFMAGVLTPDSLVLVTNLVPTIFVVGLLVPRMIKGENWRARR